MNIRITPYNLKGTVTPPPSKSMAHRLLIAAALAEGESKIENLADSQDILATKACLQALKTQKENELPHFDCGESGSTLRFMIPIALAVCGGGVFTGRGRLMERPQQPYFDLFAEKGIFYEQKDGALTVEGRLTAGIFSLAGNVSSQFITGLLYALPLLDGDSEIVLTTPLESAPYVDMTLQALGAAGIEIENENYRRFLVKGGQSYQPIRARVEADWSQAAFWYAAKFLGASLEITGLRQDSAQGDKVAAILYEKLRQNGDVEVDLSECPDLLPPLAVMAARREGTTRFINAGRLRIKESDRLTSVCRLLNALGGRAEEGETSLAVEGVPQLEGGRVDGANDHRIVMAAAIAAIACQNPVEILGAEAVSKSYPDFFEVYTALGGNCVQIEA